MARRKKRDRYLKELRKELEILRCPDVHGVLDYVKELIDESIEDGLTEAEAIENLPTPRSAAREYSNLFKGVDSSEREKRYQRRRSGRNPIALILFFPFWVVLIALHFTLLVTLWVLAIAFATLPFALCASGIACFVATPLSFAVGPGHGMLAIGAGVLLIGLGLLFILLPMAFGKLAVKFSKTVPSLYRWIFTGKGRS